MTITETALSVGATTRDRVLARISVREPYFALENLEELSPGSVRATVDVSEPKGPETGVLEAAQVGRHLAILGSCAAALNRADDDRHHYLAVQAHLCRVGGAPTEPVPAPFVAEALATWVDKRTARALTTLRTADGRATHLLDVTYAVMTPRMFRRLHPVDDVLDAQAVSGGGANHLRTGLVLKTEDGVRVDCGPITLAACAGHFPETPAAPVAVVMGELSRTAGHALSLQLGHDASYSVEEGRVTATKLARAGQNLELEASYISPVGALHRLRGVARADGDIVGELDLMVSAG